MIEGFALACGILAIVGLSVAAYCYGQFQSLRDAIADKNERITALTFDLKEWQGKALIKNGQTPLGYTPPPPKNESAPMKILSRAEMERRAAEEVNVDGITVEKPSKTTVFAEHLGVDRRDLLEKAKKIRQG